MNLAEAQRQFQIALEYRRARDNEWLTYSERQELDESVERASRELELIWLEAIVCG